MAKLFLLLAFLLTAATVAHADDFSAEVSDGSESGSFSVGP